MPPISRSAGRRTACVALLFVALVTTLGLVSARNIAKRAEPTPDRNGNLKPFAVSISGYSPTKDDDYVSVAIQAQPGYVVKFEPMAGADRVHHMLLYGCSQPAYAASFWKGSATCQGASHILYAWARNAPAFEMPNDVAIPIGNEGDPVQYLVLQIHYAHPFEGNVRDFSGVVLHLSDQRPKFIADIYLFVSGEPIPPALDASYNNMSCYYRGETTLYPMAFRTHTHAMGRAVSAYFKHDNTWTKIGKRNPQWPQLFEKVETPITIKKGDFMAATCRFDSHDKTEYVPMGSMGSNEMCNFYMMFYRSADEQDPFPNGAFCGGNENPELMASEYPSEGLTLLPAHPEWEHKAHQAGKPFGVLEKIALRKLGNVEFGQISGLAVDVANEHVVIFQRGSRIWDATTFDYANKLVDQSPVPEAAIVVGKNTPEGLEFVKAFGEGLFFVPHGIFVDDDGYYYTTDVGSHQVIKWKLHEDKLEPVLVLGEKFVPGSDDHHFCKPAGVAVSKKDKSIWVADGYCNSRIMHFDSNGKLIGKFGEPSDSGAGREIMRFDLGTFELPHDISLDEQHDRVYVADRENGRVQVFKMDHTPVTEIRDARFFANVYSAHYCPKHGLFFIPGVPSQAVPEINVFNVPLGAHSFQYSFRPKSQSFSRPHVLRALGDSVFVGEIDDAGGVLWRFDVEQEESAAHAMEAMEGGGKGQSTESTLVVLLIIGMAVGMGFLYFMRRHRVSVNSRTPTTLLDRAGFKPLRTNDFDDDDDSEDDLAISASGAPK